MDKKILGSLESDLTANILGLTNLNIGTKEYSIAIANIEREANLLERDENKNYRQNQQAFENSIQKQKIDLDKENSKLRETEIKNQKARNDSEMQLKSEELRLKETEINDRKTNSKNEYKLKEAELDERKKNSENDFNLKEKTFRLDEKKFEHAKNLDKENLKLKETELEQRHLEKMTELEIKKLEIETESERNKYLEKSRKDEKRKAIFSSVIKVGVAGAGLFMTYCMHKDEMNYSRLQDGIISKEAKEKRNLFEKFFSKLF